MHNELFNPIDIHTYYPSVLSRISDDPEGKDSKWTHLSRDLYPDGFLEHIWTGKYSNGQEIKEDSQAVGFKSFPDHWPGKNEEIWRRAILEDHRVKKIILCREDELAVYVSMKRAEITGLFMTHKYPKDIKLHIDPARLQAFVTNYRDTFQRKYKSPTDGRDTFRITYEQIADEVSFDESICPLLWKLLGVSGGVKAKRLKETVKQADDDEDLSQIITNYDELAFCFRHTDVQPFSDRPIATGLSAAKSAVLPARSQGHWTILLPICSRKTKSTTSPAPQDSASLKDSNFNANRFSELVLSSRHATTEALDEEECWARLQNVASSLKRTSAPEKLKGTVCIVGIDVDDKVFRSDQAKNEFARCFPPTSYLCLSLQLCTVTSAEFGVTSQSMRARKMISLCFSVMILFSKQMVGKTRLRCAFKKSQGGLVCLLEQRVLL
jgi:hypothetical protein